MVSKAVAGFGPLVSPEWLRAHLHDPDLRVIDFRWYLDGRSGRQAHAGGHLPGAVFVDLEEDVTGEQGDGRHPLPTRLQFASAMRRAGVGAGSRVVVYDDGGANTAARLWWLLRWFGHPDVAVLDGGLAAWGGPLSTTTEPPPEGDFLGAAPDPAAVLTHEAVRALAGGEVLLDARAPERFSGEVETIDPKAGHIPGARSAHYQGNLGADGRFLAPAGLLDRYHKLGVRSGEEVVAYCGSGVSACANLLALEVAGLHGARLYAGSWSDWSCRAGAPVATGGEQEPLL